MTTALTLTGALTLKGGPISSIDFDIVETVSLSSVTSYSAAYNGTVTVDGSYEYNVSQL